MLLGQPLLCLWEACCRTFGDVVVVPGCHCGGCCCHWRQRMSRPRRRRLELAPAVLCSCHQRRSCCHGGCILLNRRGHWHRNQQHYALASLGSEDPSPTGRQGDGRCWPRCRPHCRPRCQPHSRWSPLAMALLPRFPWQVPRAPLGHGLLRARSDACCAAACRVARDVLQASNFPRGQADSLPDSGAQRGC